MKTIKTSMPIKPDNRLRSSAVSKARNIEIAISSSKYPSLKTDKIVCNWSKIHPSTKSDVFRKELNYSRSNWQKVSKS